MMASLLQMLKISLKHGPSLKYIAFCPYYSIPSHPFTASPENQGVKSCTNNQFTETGIHSKPRAHVLDTFFSSRVLENLPWERRHMEGTWEVLQVNKGCTGHSFLKNWFARSFFMWTIMWLHLAPQPCSGPGSSLVFCVVQSKTVNSHRDYNMLDTFYPVGRKHTAWHRWGSPSHCICCGLWGVCREIIWLVLLTAYATTQFYSSTKQPTFAFGANISFPREPTHTLVL